MDPIPEPTPQTKAPSTRLIWILALLAVLSSGVAALAWSRGAASEVPQIDTVQNLIRGGTRAAEIAPDFRVPTLGGGSFSLADHFAAGGAPVFLNLWASWCPPCRAEMPAIDAAAARHPNVKFVGVAVQDDFEAAARFAEEIGVSYTIGFDEKYEVNTLYPSAGLPVTFLIDADGTLVQTLYGQLDDSRIDFTLATWFGS
jgi:thiol-disulfide isomerase/thioredoxin